MFATSQIAGNLTATPELRHVGSANDIPVTDFTLAVNDTSGGKDKVYFFNLCAWRGQAKALAEYCKKGDRLTVVCEMRQDRWVDEKSGTNRSREYHVVSKISFPPKPRRETAAPLDTSKPMSTQELAEHVPLSPTPHTEVPKYNDDDIPF